VIPNLQRHLETEISIQILFSSTREAKTALKALIPDNANFPKGLSMKMFSRGQTLAILIHGRMVPAATIINTIDEVLEHVSIAQKVMVG
jgi:hypothetical protein